jgi:hypothetical protein
VFQKNIFAGMLILTFILAPCAYAGKVEYPTLYPSPNGEYQYLYSTNDSYFATSSGYVGIGMASGAAVEKLDIAGNVRIPQGNYLIFYHANNEDYNDGKLGAALFDVGLNIVGIQTVAAGGRQIRYWGTFAPTSDIRYKDVNYYYDGASVLEKFGNLRAINFNWKKDNPTHEVGTNLVGISAQEIEQVFPELVTDGKMKSVNYIGMIPLMVEGIKELNQRNAMMVKTGQRHQTQIELLKKEIEELKKR